MRKCLFSVALFSAATLAVFGQAAKPLVVASTPDMGALVRAVAGDDVELSVIMPAGADPHTVNISATQVRAFGRAELVVLAYSKYHEFEGTVRAVVPAAKTLDWPDYAARGASLRDYPGYPQNPHGPWLRLDNALAMAEAIAERLPALGLPEAVVQARLQDFDAEVRAQQQTCVRLADEHGLRKRPVLAVIPGACDIVANLGIPVGRVLMAEGSGTVSGQALQDAVQQLRAGGYSGIVCPLSMKQSRQGEAARQVAADSGAPLVYVRFLDTDLRTDSYLSVNTYNTAALIGLAGGAGAAAAVSGGPGSRLLPLSVAGAACAALVGLLIGLSLRRRARVVYGAGIFADTTTDTDSSG